MLLDASAFIDQKVQLTTVPDRQSTPPPPKCEHSQLHDYQKGDSVGEHDRQPRSSARYMDDGQVCLRIVISDLPRAGQSAPS